MDPEASYAALHGEVCKLLTQLQAVHEQELRRRRLRKKVKVKREVDEMPQVEVGELFLSPFRACSGGA